MSDSYLELADEPRTSELADEVQYAVLCRRDETVRDISTPNRAEAQRWAASRDVECGRCYPEHNPHVVVTRTCTPWIPIEAIEAADV